VEFLDVLFGIMLGGAGTTFGFLLGFYEERIKKTLRRKSH